MSWVDLTLLLILASFTANGAMQGLTRQIANLAGLVVGLILASRLYRPLAYRLGRRSISGIAVEPLFFVLILLGTWILVNVLAFALRTRTSDDDDPWLDSLAGASLGLATGVLMLALLIVGVAWLGLPVARQIKASWLGGWLGDVGHHLAGPLFG